MLDHLLTDLRLQHGVLTASRKARIEPAVVADAFERFFSSHPTLQQRHALCNKGTAELHNCPTVRWTSLLTRSTLNELYAYCREHHLDHAAQEVKKYC